MANARPNSRRGDILKNEKMPPSQTAATELLRVQLEIDLNVVMVALAEPVGQWLDSADAIRKRFD